jgi:hypothetical protein
MRFDEIGCSEIEMKASDNMKLYADTMMMNADAAKARLKIKDAQSKLVKAMQPVKPKQYIEF